MMTMIILDDNDDDDDDYDDNDDDDDDDEYYDGMGNLGPEILLLAPTGALIVLMVFYSIRSARRPLFEIFSISANIFSFSF